MSDDRMLQMAEIAPTFNEAIADLQACVDEARREWSGELMSRFRDKTTRRLWMLWRARRLRRQLSTGSVEFNAICNGEQVTICSSETMKPKAIPQEHSLCVVTVGEALPLAVDDVLEDPVVKDHPASEVCRAWASYPVMVNGTAAGTVCALDSPEPRKWNKDDEKALEQAAQDLGDRISLWLNTRT